MSGTTALRGRLPRALVLLACLACLAGIGWLAGLNWRLYRPGRVEPAVAQVRFLEVALDDGAADRMQEWFPEGYVFTWALYGLAAAQAAAALPEDDDRRGWLLDAASEAVTRVQSDVARRTFTREMDPEYGAFYASWSLYPRAVLLRAVGPDGPVPFDLAAFERDCARFADALTRHDTPFLPSYPGMVWPADTGVGVAALAIRDAVLGARYGAVIERWVAGVEARLDPPSGAIRHAEPGPASPDPGGAIRGESIALMALTLVDVDLGLARRQYEILRRDFMDYVAGVPGVREYPHGVEGRGDVDSGPLVLGFSGPAVVVGAGAAIAHGDDDAATALLATAEVIGWPVELAGRRRYAAGRVPVGDAFLAWARTVTPHPGAAGRDYAPVFPRLWRLPVQLLSLLVAGVLGWIGYRVAPRCPPDDAPAH